VCEVMTATIPRSAPAVGTASVAAGRGIAVLRRWWPPVLSGLLMAVIGLVGATRPVMSWDEIATADVAQRSLPQIWHLAQHVDGVLAPYYVVMHFWTALVGDSVLDLRLPSIVAMAVAVAAAADRTVAAIIHDRQHPGDVIVYEGGRTMRAGVGYYLRHVAGAPPDVLVCASAADRGLLTAAECPDPSARLTAAARVWLVVYGRRADPLTDRKDLAASLTTRFRRAGVWRAKAATLGLYIPAIRLP
jgi:hypothetical protein